MINGVNFTVSLALFYGLGIKLHYNGHPNKAFEHLNNSHQYVIVEHFQTMSIKMLLYQSSPSGKALMLGNKVWLAVGVPVYPKDIEWV